MSGRASSAERNNIRSAAPVAGLAARRRQNRRRITLVFGIFFLLLLGAVVYGLWQNAVRISHIQIFGADARQSADLSAYATEAIQGSYWGIIPRDSIFFFPEARVRADILAAHPDIAAISIFRSGLTELSIKANKRLPVARWCSSFPDGTPDREDCYFFDAKGFVYATTSIAIDTANSISPVNPFIVYGSLMSDKDEENQISLGSFIGITLPNAKDFPSAFDFARQLSTLGSPVARIVFRNDEIDDYLTSGTRITYVLGDEQNAFTALVSARTNLNLSDGSLEYVDVRFDGKVYMKKKAGI